eukprot:m.47409 g.47409  ORF g.47409 m.47409 type:complete len:508 (-) comp10497_c0_seq2:151-1674(-)
MGNANRRQVRGGDGARGPYWYNPENGLYFGNQFIMGGQEFPALDPEAFLFGDMGDLNHLSRVPGVATQPPQNVKHTNTIQSLVSLNKETLRLVHHADSRADGEDSKLHEVHLEFSFDADVPCNVEVHFFATENTDAAGITRYSSKLSWPARRYEAGLGQKYSHPNPALRLSSYTEDEMFLEKCAPRFYPIVIEIKAEVDHSKPHIHSTFATFDGSMETLGSMSVKPLIQRLSVDGLTLVLKEIYGIERKDDEEEADEFADDNTECVVCMSDVRDTMALPCRHLCLCNPCAEVLRYQANKCPICRAPFHSLLQVRVFRRQEEVEEANEENEDDENEEDKANIPPGCKVVSIVTALRENGPSSAGGNTSAVETITSGDTDPSAETAGPAIEDGYLNVMGADNDDPDKENSISNGKNKVADSSAATRPSSGADVVVHDFPSNERLKIDDHVVGYSKEKDDGDGQVGEFSLPGTPDSMRMKVQHGERQETSPVETKPIDSEDSKPTDTLSI